MRSTPSGFSTCSVWTATVWLFRSFPKSEYHLGARARNMAEGVTPSRTLTPWANFDPRLADDPVASKPSGGEG